MRNTKTALLTLLLCCIVNFVSAQCPGLALAISPDQTVYCGTPANINLLNNSTGSNASTASFEWLNGGTPFDTTVGTAGVSDVVATVGTVNYTVIATDTSGCQDTVNFSVEVAAFPSPSFTLAPNPFCASQLVTFSNTSTNTLAGTTYAWDFGDGSTSSLENPNHTYAQPGGNFTVSLVVTNPSGCIDSVSQVFNVSPFPTPSFILAPNPPCTDQLVAFGNTSTNTVAGTTYAWDFGDGNTSNQENPAHSYAQPGGSFTVTLVVTNPSGCIDSVSQVVNVLPSPVANFFANPATFCLAAGDTATTNTVGFFNSSTGGASYEWDFGDGSPTVTTSSTGGGLTHTYTQFGSFTVVMTATGANGCTSIDSTVIIFDRNVVAGIGITLPQTSGCAPFTITPTNQSINGTTYIWDFGDGTPPDTTNLFQAPTHTYDSTGSFSITVFAINACDTADITYNTITVGDVPEVAFLMGGIPFCAPADVSFNNLSTGASPGNNYFWDFGRDPGDTLANTFFPPNQTYNQGAYTVTLTGTNGCGSSSFSLPLLVDSIPIANVLATPDIGCNPLGVIFLNGSDPLALHDWSLFGGLLTFTSYQIPPQIFPAIGSINTHDINYTVTNLCGSDDTTITVTVLPEADADFTASTLSICAGDSVTFVDQSTGGIISWDWNFGNGNSSNAQGPHTQAFNIPGLIPVNLTVDNGQCLSSHVVVIEVRPNPTASFNPVSDSACVPATIAFTNNSTFNAIHSWTFGGGATPATASGFNPPNVTFPNVGTQEVTLTVDLMGCIRSDTQTVEIMPAPVPGFTVTPQDGCSPLTVAVTNTSVVSGGETWFWDFGDGTTSTLQNPGPHTYVNSGTADIVRSLTLTVTTDFGCVASVSTPITIHPLPVAGFNALATACLGETVNFANTSTGAASITFEWEFGDGNISSLSNPSHIYSGTGNFTVELIAITAFGCRDTIAQTILVEPIPVPNFSADTVCANAFTTFTDLSTGSPVSWQWDFGDGNTSILQNPSHTYAGPGTFNVQLIATNGLNCPDSITIPVNVRPNPVAGFTAPVGACLGEVIPFTNTSTGATSFDWDFGDGNTSTQTNPNHSYGASGTFTIELIATNGFGCQDTFYQVILIDTIPVPNFIADTVCLGAITTFTDLSTSSGSVTAWAWEFGDGNTSVLQNPTHLYATPGTFNVQLIATNAAGCPDTIVQAVVVHPVPTANFAAPGVCLGETSIFTDQSTGAPTAFFWDFGDGNTSNLPNPTHIYAIPNTYSVSLIVTNLEGCSDTLVQTHTVDEVPVASFVADTACFGAFTFFDATGSTNSPNQFAWDFGDGNTDNTNNSTPVHLYAAPGTYSVTLVAGASATGCADTISVSVLVNESPIADFSADTVCQGALTTFSDLSTNNFPGQWDWDFGDGNSSNLQNPTHVYASPGTFAVTFIVTNSLGCSDTIVGLVEVNPVPVAAFSAPNACFGSASIFTDNSTGNPTGWNWNFGDGNGSVLQNPTHVYAAPGSYNITLITTNGFGCADTATGTHIVDPTPIATFSADTVCFGDATSFDATASVGSPNTFSWTFGDGNTDNTNNASPSHTYGTAGTFSVTLIAGIGATGCADTTTLDVIVRETPVAAFTADTVCLNLITTFTDQSTNNFPNQWSWDLGDGNSSSLQSPTHLYGTDGTFNVQLVVENTFGCIDSVSNPVVVEPLPVAGFTAQAQACVGEVVPFTNNSTGAASFNWNFDDGNTSLLANPSHSYAVGGTFTIELIANTSFGCADTVTQTIVVDTLPVPNFVADTVCIGNATTFNDLSTGFPNNWDWAFGDGNTSVLQNPTHLYAVPGTFNVSLTVFDGPGCIDSITIPVLVNPIPTAAFTAPAVCFPAASQFTDNSTGTPVSFDWDFGDGNTSNQQNPLHAYAAPGNYTVTLIVFSGVGCSDTVSINHDVFPIPAAIFSADTVCFGDATSFNATASTGPPNTYFWDFGDGNTDNTNNATPTHLYATADTFTVTLVAGFVATGCVDTTTLDVIVRETPVAAFAADTVCLNLITTFTDQSTNNFPNQWSWDLGDGNSSSLQSPTHLYGTDGTFNVQLVVENTFGCIDSVSNPVVVEPLPVAGFTAQAQACVGEVVPFTNNSTGATSFNWNFGDGNTSTLPNPSHSYAVGGTFTIELIANTSFGCADTVTQTIVVDTIPIPDFIADTVCVGNFTSFTDLSSGTPVSWDWDFGDGNSSVLQNPTHLYAVPGTFNVSLTVFDGPGCIDSITIPVLVNPIPTAAFTAPAVCFPAASQFTDNSTGTPVSFDWDFGDGNTSSQQNPLHAYAAPGNYTVTLIVFSGVGCSDTVSINHDVFPIPTAIFSRDTVCFGDSTSFDATASVGPPNTYFWDFGDGNTDNTNNATPTHLYATADTFTVTLVAGFVATGCVDTTTLDVIVRETPVAAFAADTVCLNLITTFTDQSTNNFPNQWSWDLGDGNSSSLQSPTHLYGTDGTFNVQLVVENTFGCIDSVSNPVVVEPLPVAGFTAQAQACVGEVVPFTNNSTGAASFNWNFGDGNTSLLANPSHSYAVGGTFTIELIANTSFGCADTVTQTIVVDTIPVPDFVADTVCVGNFTSFTDLSTGSVANWGWDFGDGNGSILQSPTHLYASAGTFNVQLAITDGPGCQDSITIPVLVNPIPTAAFTAPAVCFPAASQFTDNSTGTPVSFDWDFGDGNTSSQQNPLHAYAAPGNYTVTLIVFSGVGCSDTVSINHDVFPIPTAIFSADTVCFGDVTSFDASASIGAPDSLFWDFGDGTTDNTNNATPTHLYATVDTFTVTLVAGFGATGCTDTTTLEVIVRETPVAAFTADTVCLNLITTFTDQSTNNFPSQWSWDLGDGNSSSLQSPTHLYGTDGTFNVQLVVENTFGCIDSVTNPVVVEPLPVAGFTAQAQACVGEVVPFTNNSTGAASFNWNFGDGNTSTLPNPSHSYAAGDTFTIELIANTSFGCADTVTQTIVVDTIPVPDFVADTVCVGNFTSFTDLSTGSVANWGWDFGDGNGSILQSPTHLYASAGTFNVQLAITDGPGCQDSITIPVLVNPIPTAAFTAPAVCFPAASQFTDNSTGTPVSFDWDFGDGNTSNQPNPLHAYAAPGNYTVTLIVFSGVGCSDTVSINHDVFPIPTAIFSADTVCFGDVTSFDASASIGAPDSLFWDFGDGTTDNTNNDTPTHTYTSADTFTVTLIAGFGATACVDTTTLEVIVRETPVATFVADTVCLNLITTFTDQSTNNFPSQWSWDLGDGNSSSLQSPTHLYGTDGTFNVQLVVENTFGCIDSVTNPVVVEPLPVAGFTATSGGCVGENIPFTNTSTGATNYLWDFGDGDSSSVTSPIHVYSSFGTFTVELIAITGFGCRDTISQPISLDTLPVPNFVADTVCIGSPTTFTDLSTGSVMDWAWDFDDGNNSTVPSPVHLYGNPGIYNVQLTVMNGFGCTDSLTIPVVVNPEPSAGFLAPDVCFTSPSVFTDTSIGTPTVWDWDFGDGDTSNLQNPLHFYAAPGNYTVTLIVFSGVGCSDTISASHEVFPIPTAIFSRDTVCFGDSTSFDATASVGPPNTYFWDFGDGSTDNTNNPSPSHLYASADTFTVTLVAGFGSTGCTDTTSLEVIVRETPIAVFVADTVCLNLVTTFTDQSTNNFPNQWSWDLGDGNSSSLQSPTHLYGTAGTFNVQLVVENTFGCIDSVTNPVIVEPLPVAGFTATSGGCVGESIPFTNTSTGATNYLWDFGDGDSSTATSPIHVYSTFGTFTVELIAITGFGCRDTISQPIQLDTLPAPNFVADTVCIGSPTTFTDLSTGSVVDWDWDFDDGDSSTLQNPVHLYANPGVYDVQLIVMNTLGCTDSITIPVEVYPEPTAGFLAPDVCFTSPSIFTDTSIGAPTVWDWDFGDGNGSVLQNPTHFYAAPGIYNVTLIVFSGLGCSDTVSVNHEVFPIPTAIFTRDTVCFGDSTFFDGTVSLGSPDTYFWDFGDGTSDNTNTPSLHHTYPAAGTYTVMFVAGFGSTGCTDTTSLDVIVRETPVAIFQADTVCLNLFTTFLDQSGNNFPNLWAWDFGDGNGSVQQNPIHLYGTADTFAVQLVVENTFGCIDSVTRDVIVNPLPVAEFAFDTVCLNLPTTFTDLSTDAVNYDWDFGDGNGSVLASPTHVYAAPGTYTVTQIVFNVFGCSDTIQHDIIVSPYPVADFNVTTACFGYATDFTDLSTGNLVSWDWDFGDAIGTSNVPSPSYIYGDSGVFSVSLVVTNNFGCTDTAIQPVTVLPIPVAGFTYPIECARELVQFTDTSLGLPSSWSWDFGDASPLNNTQNPGHIYDPGGEYTVTFIAGNIFGCFDTLVAPVTVNTVPVPDFAAPPVCQGEVTQFMNLSMDTVTNTMSYLWDFGDSNNSFGQDPGYVYADSGIYNVTLFTSNNHGCIDSITQPVYVAPAPVADFIASTVCLGEMTDFTDLSSPWVTGWFWDFGDGTTSNVPNPSHAFATSGNHTVGLVVFTSNSCVDTVVQNLNVQVRPEASFTFSPAQCAGGDISFVSTSLNNPAVWAWDFGDGTTSSLENPLHSYATGGFYTVTLIASTPNACSDTTSLIIEVFENPIAEFAVDTVCLGIPTFFENESSGAVSYFWTFGNLSNSSAAEEPGYIFFDTAGVYNVSLVVTSAEGCVDTVVYPAVVADFPQAEFMSDPPIPSSLTTDNAFLTFTNLSTGGLSYVWNFGDGNTSADQDPDHMYNDPGSYCVSLLVTGLAGCEDSIEVCGLEIGTGIPDIPNLFTPNGDGTNDNFVVRNISEFPNNRLQVFNRWGSQVYEKQQYNNEWNGINSANGQMLPDGGYFYIFSPGDGEEDVVGDVVIMR